MNKEELEEYENPYCEVCGTCGCIGCCGIRNFITEHIEGKTNCKNEGWIIQDLINLCDYKDKVFKDNKKYKEVLDKIKEYGENCLENLKDQDDYIDESINVVALLKMIHKNYLELLEEING